MSELEPISIPALRHCERPQAAWQSRIDAIPRDGFVAALLAMTVLK